MLNYPIGDTVQKGSEPTLPATPIKVPDSGLVPPGLEPSSCQLSTTKQLSQCYMEHKNPQQSTAPLLMCTILRVSKADAA